MYDNNVTCVAFKYYLKSSLTSHAELVSASSAFAFVYKLQVFGVDYGELAPPVFALFPIGGQTSTADVMNPIIGSFWNAKM